MNHIITLACATAIANLGMLFVALGNIGLGIALWVTAVVVYLSAPIADIWREFGARRARDPQRVAGQFAQLYESARAVIRAAPTSKT